MKLRHHRLHLRTVEHSHEDRLDDIIVMMAECNLVAAELLCKMIQMAAAHSRAEITRGIFHMVDRIENVCLENGDRNVESNIFRSVENVNIDTVVGYKQHGIRHNFLEGYDDNPGYMPEAEKAAAETEQEKEGK